MSEQSLVVSALPKARRVSVRSWGPSLGFGVAAIVLWQIADSLGLVARTIPSPFELIKWFGTVFPTGSFQLAIRETVWAAFISFVVTALVGIIVGVAAGLSKTFSRLVDGLIEFFRPIPSVVYLPLILLLFGMKINSVIILVIGGAVWPVILQTAAGVRDADPVLIDAARAYNIRGFRLLRRIIFPGMLPFVATGLRIAATMSIVIVVTVELLGTGKGLGGIIAGAYVSGNYANLFGAAFVAAVLGLITEQLLALLEKRVLHWHPSTRLELQ